MRSIFLLIIRKNLRFSIEVSKNVLALFRHLCRPCHNREKARGLGKYICQKCHAIIDEQPLIFKNDPYHPDHFNCANCGYCHPLPFDCTDSGSKIKHHRFLYFCYSSTPDCFSPTFVT